MIFTFYSYKGGVGRSMALANVASTLALRGLRVLMIDFDLEAPGLEQFFPIHHAGIRRNPGLLDLLLSYKQSMSLAGDEESDTPPFMRLEETFLQSVYKSLGSGKLDLLHAGQREGGEQLARYAYNLRSFDWQDFYFNWAGEAFFEWLRQALVPKLYDIVLVDSRTGVTEMGGICAYQLADTIVMFCAANRQNVEGTYNVVGNFFSPEVQERRQSRRLEVLVVPSRIEQRDGDMLQDFRQRFEARFSRYTPSALRQADLGFWDFLIPYEASYAFEERVVEQRPPREESSPITAAFERLADAIARMGRPETASGKAAEEPVAGSLREPATPLYDVTRKFAGYDALLSFHSSDAEAVETIALRLREAGILPFLDRWEIVPGEDWQEKVEEALFQSRAYLLFLGSAGLGPWEQKELRAALRRRLQEPDFRVIPVLLPGAPAEPERLPFLGEFTWLDLQDGLDNAAAFSRLLNALMEAAPTPSRTLVAHGTPYPGLRPFLEEDSPFFFGREDLVQSLIDVLGSGARRLTIYGASGSGKSSLVRAGLFPALRGGALPGSGLWPLVRARVGTDPLATLIEDLEQLRRDLSGDPGQPGLPRTAEGGEGLVTRIRAITGSEGDGTENPERQLLLFIDQFEEILTVCPEERRKAFLDSLLSALEAPRSPLRIIIAVRSDFLSLYFEHFRTRSASEDHLFQVIPLTRDQMRKAIEMPAQKVGLAFEVGLVERILDDAGNQPGALPLVQLLLRQLWQHRRGAWLTVSAYEEIGGVRGVLDESVQEVYRRLGSTDREIARRILLRLISTAEGAASTRRRTTLTELHALHGDRMGVEQVLSRLVDAGLVAVGTMPEEEPVVELAHEILIRNDLVQHWLQEDRKFLRWRDQLRPAVADWQRSGREAGFLLRGSPLTLAETFLADRSGDLTADEQAFIQAGLALRKRERKQAFWTVSATILLTIITIAATWMTRETKERSRAAISRELATQASSKIRDDLSLALLLSVEALRAADTQEARNSLRSALDSVGASFLAESPARHAGVVESIAFAPNGRLVASGSDDGTILLWDVVAGRSQSLRLPIPGEADGLAFSPDGRLLALGKGNEIVLWNLGKGSVVDDILRGHTRQVESLAFSPDGQLLASSSDDRSVILWDVSTWKRLQTLKGHRGEVDSVAFSPDGKMLASGSEDRSIRLWSVATSEFLGSLQGHTDGVDSVAFSPDGNMLASGSDDGSIVLWDVPVRRARETLRGHRRGINSIAFSRDGKLLASGGESPSILLWSLATRKPLSLPLARMQPPVESVAFSPNGTTLASGGGDRRVLLWDVLDRHPVQLVNTVNIEPDDWIVRACEIANRDLNEAEWNRYLPDEPYRPTCLPH